MLRLICEDFIGRWSITRRIHDNLNGSVSYFFGEADIKKEGLYFHYQEQGKLKLGGNATLKAKQSYFWRPVGNTIFDIFFNNGDYFHKLDLGIAEKPDLCFAEHLCMSDLYRVHYSLAQFPDWRTIWCVTGPKKKYEIFNYFEQI